MPTFWTRLAMVVVLTTGAVFVMWLGEQITERGIGNGMSLLITFSILDRLWPGPGADGRVLEDRGALTWARSSCSGRSWWERWPR